MKRILRTEYYWYFGGALLTRPFRKNDRLRLYDVRIVTYREQLGIFLGVSLKVGPRSKKYIRTYARGEIYRLQSMSAAEPDIKKWLSKIQTSKDFVKIVHNPEKSYYLLFNRDYSMPSSHQVMSLFLHMLVLLEINSTTLPVPEITAQIYLLDCNDSVNDYPSYLAEKFYGDKLRKDSDV